MFISDFAIKQPVITVVTMLALVGVRDLSRFSSSTPTSFRRSARRSSPSRSYIRAPRPTYVEREIIDPIEEVDLRHQRRRQDHVERASTASRTSSSSSSSKRTCRKRRRRSATRSLNPRRSAARDGGADPHAVRPSGSSDCLDDAVVDERDRRRAHAAGRSRVSRGELRALRGVARGQRRRRRIERELTVESNPTALQASGIGIGQVVQALQAQNLAAPVGRITGDLEERTIRLRGRLGHAGRVRAARRRRTGGRVIRLGRRRRRACGHRRAARRRRCSTASRPSASTSSSRRATARRRWPTTCRREVDADSADACPGMCRSRIVRDAGVRVENSVSNVQEALFEGAAADRARRVPLPQLVALDGHHRSRAAGLGARLVRRGSRVRLHAEHDVAARPVAGDRHPDRRRDRRAREHRPALEMGRITTQPPRKAPTRSGLRSPPRRSRSSSSSSDRVHGRYRRAVVRAVRADDRELGAGVAVRVVLARPDVVGLLARPARRGIAAVLDHAYAEPVQQTGSTGRPIDTRGSSRGRSTIAGRWSAWRSRRSSARSRCRRSASSAAASSRSRTSRSSTSSIETPPGSNLEYTRLKAEEAARLARSKPEVAYTYTTIGGRTGAVDEGTVYVAAHAEGASATAIRKKSRPTLRNELLAARRRDRIDQQRRLRQP